MRYLIFIFLAGCMHNSPNDIVASKCRLKVPVQKTQCETVGIKHTKGGQLEGLPVTKGKS